MNIKKIALMLVVGCGSAAALTSCSDILETSSELVEYEKDNTLDHPTDSLYSVMGIINKIQLIADRTVLLYRPCSRRTDAFMPRCVRYQTSSENIGAV